GTVHYKFNLTNGGNAAENVSLSSGSGIWNERFNVTGPIEILPGQTVNLSGNFTLLSNLQAGSQEIPVTISYGTGTFTSYLPVNVTSVVNFSVSQSLKEYFNGTSFVVPVNLTNTGTTGTNISLSLNNTILSENGWVGIVTENGSRVNTVYLGFNQSKTILLVLYPNVSKPSTSFQFALHAQSGNLSDNFTVSVRISVSAQLSPYPTGTGILANYTGNPETSLITGIIIIAVAVVAGLGIAAYRGRRR
ncbi:MAG TPA: hypothetical protein VKU79_00060, partial [Thermoplasmataceae archaeon]|nr:hypothetical protein [Thermoplasmataceae archaeon]